MSRQFARFPIAIIRLHDALYALSHRIDQFAAAYFPRLDAFTDDMLHVECPAPLDIGHHSLPLLQIPLHQPFDQALDLDFDLLRHIGQHLFLELSSYPVTAYQSLDIGQAQGIIEEVEAALLQSVQDIFHLCQARAELALQIALVVADGGLQSRGSLLVLLQILRLDLVEPLRLRDQMIRHTERVAELELKPRRVIKRGSDILI